MLLNQYFVNKCVDERNIYENDLMVIMTIISMSSDFFIK